MNKSVATIPRHSKATAKECEILFRDLPRQSWRARREGFCDRQSWWSVDHPISPVPTEARTNSGSYKLNYRPTSIVSVEFSVKKALLIVVALNWRTISQYLCGKLLPFIFLNQISCNLSVSHCRNIILD